MTRAERRVAAALALLALVARPAAAARPGCLVEWRVAGPVACRDGETGCDADGVVDGACTFGVRLCVNVDACAGGPMPAVRVRGPGSRPLAAAVGALGT